MQTLLIVLISAMVIITVVLFLYKLNANSTSQRTATIMQDNRITPPKLEISDIPDYPKPFGYKCQWIVVKTKDTGAIVKHLNLVNIQSANWSTGIAGAYEGLFFVSPPLNGWTLIVNSLMPAITNASEKEPLSIIVELSEIYGEAYYFGTHRIVEYHAWAKASKGILTRAYCFIGESGETLINQGTLTPEEVEHELIFTDIEDDDPILPNEDHVLIMAREWTIDPTMEQNNGELGLGYVGKRK